LTPVSAPADCRLSVVIPNYNHRDHVADAVRAAAAQVPPPDEIIVVDDASRDDSLEVLARLSAEIPALRVVALPVNGGAIRALNRGVAEARGEYVYLGAADDLTRPGLFAALMPMALRHPDAALVCAEAEIVDLDTGEVQKRPPVRPSRAAKHFPPREVARLFRRIDNWILTGAAIIRRDLMLAAGGLDVNLGALADGYTMRRLAFGHGCCFVPFTGLVWQIRATGLSRSQAADPDQGLRALATALASMRADPAFPAWYPEVFERRWRFAVSRVALKADPINSAVLQRVGARSGVDRVVLRAAVAVGGGIGRFAALGWLSLRGRPTSFFGLLATYLSRFVGRGALLA
jgi:hypothetical protein